MEMQIIIKPEIEKSALQEVFEAQSLMVRTREDYEIGQVYMGRIKQRIKMLEEERMAQTRPLDESKKRIIDFFRPHLDKLNGAKNHLNIIMVKWTEEQEARRREEERRLQDDARKRAEEEALKAAIEAEEAGEKEEAEQIMAEPVYVPSIRVASEIPKSKESHVRESWSAEIIDVMALVKGIAGGQVDIQAIEPNNLIKTHSFLNTMASRYKLTLNIPGVRAVSKKTQI